MLSEMIDFMTEVYTPDIYYCITIKSKVECNSGRNPAWSAPQLHENTKTMFCSVAALC